MPKKFKLDSSVKKAIKKTLKKSKKAGEEAKKTKASKTTSRDLPTMSGKESKLKKADTSKRSITPKKRDLTKEKAKTFKINSGDKRDGVIFRGLSKAERLKVTADAIRRKRAKGAKNVKARLRKAKK